jgi:hypothetical protein
MSEDFFFVFSGGMGPLGRFPGREGVDADEALGLFVDPELGPDGPLRLEVVECEDAI